jgi:hypothetical protein
LRATAHDRAVASFESASGLIRPVPEFAGILQLVLAADVYLALIGGAVFSAGAGGNTGSAPAFCASALGHAGCGDGFRFVLAILQCINSARRRTPCAVN